MTNIELYSSSRLLSSAEDAIDIGATLKENYLFEIFWPQILIHRHHNTQSMSNNCTKPTTSRLVTFRPFYDKKVDLFVDVKKMQKKGKKGERQSSKCGAKIEITQWKYVENQTIVCATLEN